MVKSFLLLSVVISVKVWFCVHLINERDAFSDKKQPVITGLDFMIKETSCEKYLLKAKFSN